MSKSRAVVPYGNDLVLYIEMKRWDEQQKSYIDFDMTNVTDLVVFLTCSKHSTDIQLEYTVDEDHNNILVCPVDYRLLHTNASYGCYVEGYDENEKHFRFEMLPSELMLIISNTSGMQPDPNIGVIDIQGRVGWGIGEDPIVLTYGQPIPQGTLDYIFEKNPPVEVKFNDTLYVNLQTKIENNILYFLYIRQLQSQGNFVVTQIMYNINTNIWKYWIDTFSNSADITNKLSTKQDTLVSGTNIKTINNQSILGEGNITIEGGGTQVQADWTETDTEDPSYIQHKPDLSIYAESANLATVATSGDYDDLTNKPTLFSGDYDDLTNKPDLSIYAESSDLATVATTGSYNDLSNKPDLSNYATQSDLASKQDTLVSGTNIKTINNESILGSGNITIDNDEANEATANALFELNQKTNYNEQAIEALDASVKSQINQVVKDVNDIINNDVNAQLDEIDDELKAAALEINQLNTDKQDTLVSGTNIKTINNQSILGEGNITIEGGGGSQVQADWAETDTSDPSYIQHKPDLSIYAQSANLATVATSGSYNDLSNKPDLSNYATQSDLASKQDTLVSGTNIKTINNESIIGSGNITIDNDEANEATANALFELNQKTNYNEQAIETLDTSVKTQINQVVNDVNDIINNDVNSQLDEIDNEFKSAALEISQLNTNKQDTLVSGTNIKTINNESILGTGNISITQVQADWNETGTSSPAYIQNKPTISTPGFIQYTNPNSSTKIGLINSLSTNYNTNIGKGAVIEGTKDSDSSAKIEASGQFSHAEGGSTKASAQYSHAEGYATTSSKYYAHAEGYSTTASGMAAHAEGQGSQATNEDAHAEGYYTTASGNHSHTEGRSTTASGANSHAEGYSTTASGSSSHAEGSNTLAQNDYEHASGKFNNSTKTNTTFGNNGNTLFSVGNGSSTNTKHNAFEVRQNGDLYIADTNNTTYSNYYEKPMMKIQDVMVTSSTTGLKIEVVSALPASPDSNTIYIIQ